MQKQINTLNFKGQNIYVGFDAHLKSWQVTILTENMEPNDAIVRIAKKLLNRVYFVLKNNKKYEYNKTI